MHEEIQKIKYRNYKHVSYHIKQWQNKDELKNQNISGVKNQKKKWENISSVGHGDVNTTRLDFL
jgi:hypothetical protein